MFKMVPDCSEEKKAEGPPLPTILSGRHARRSYSAYITMYLGSHSAGPFVMLEGYLFGRQVGTKTRVGQRKINGCRYRIESTCLAKPAN